MTITNGTSKKKLTLYLPTKPLMDIEEPIWGEEEDSMAQTIHLVLNIDMALALRPPEEDTMIYNFLQNLYSGPFLLGDIVIMQDWEATEVLINEPMW